MQTKLTTVVAVMFLAIPLIPALAQDGSFIGSMGSKPAMTVSTIPSNGDLNPYGVAVVPEGFPPNGTLKVGDILVSNFNNGNNLQGTGGTIVQVQSNGSAATFFREVNAPIGRVGLTTALGILRKGFVLVGNLPTTDGTCANINGSGSLLVIDGHGRQISTLVNPTLLNGPWDLAVQDQGSTARVFVSDVLSGTVVRLNLRVSNSGVQVESATQIASGYVHRCDPNALVVGPTGVAYDADREVLYVASTGDNEIFAIANAAETENDAGMGTLVYQDATHLHGPALALTPFGTLLASQGDAVNPDANQPSEIVEFTKSGQFVAQFSVDTTGQGGAFGFAIKASDEDLRFAAVDDVNNTLEIFVVE